MLFRSFCCMKEFGDVFDCVTFPRLLISWRKLQLSPLIHCPVGLPLLTISKNSLYTLFCSLILDHGVLLIISIWRQNFYFVYLARYFSSPLSSICGNQVQLSSDESPGPTIPMRSWVSQTLVFLICTILPRCHQVEFSSLTIKFRPT